MNKEKEQRAIEYLRGFEPKDEPYYLCYSGGKDSDCIRILAELAGVKFECKNNVTTVDAPETMKYIAETVGKEVFVKPEKSMWKLIIENGGPPTRLYRFCCSKLKESGGKGRLKVTGVRWAESNNRKNNQGIATIVGKPKSTQEIGNEENADFRLTDKGGWY